MPIRTFDRRTPQQELESATRVPEGTPPCAAQVNGRGGAPRHHNAHKLGKDEALRQIKPALGKASESFWMDFRFRALGQAASGNVQVADAHVRLEVTLP